MENVRGSTKVEEAYRALEDAIVEHVRPKDQISPLTSMPPRGALSTLALSHGTDKHDNCRVYELYFRHLRDEPINILEIGVDKGASLRTWRDYFRTARILAIDIEDKISHAEERVEVFQGSQADQEFLRAVARLALPAGLDIIVDDGSHVSEHIITSFETLFPTLKKGGYYVVEDVGTSYWPHNGGSRDLNDPKTTMNYFKRAADGLQWAFSNGAVIPTEITASLGFVHFWHNFIVLQKA